MEGVKKPGRGEKGKPEEGVSSSTHSLGPSRLWQRKRRRKKRKGWPKGAGREKEGSTTEKKQKAGQK